MLFLAGTAQAATILVWGDSLSAGYGLRPGEAWPTLLQTRLERQGFRHRVVNASGGRVNVLFPKLAGAFPAGEHVIPTNVTLSAEDGVEFHNQLFVPKKVQPGDRRPAVIFVHGGPQRQMLLGYHYRHFYHMAYGANQWLASKGYVVLSVNYRSGIGYGRSFRTAADTGGRGNAEYRDVLAAGKYLQSRDDVDPARIGIWGLSYGGVLTAQAQQCLPDTDTDGVVFGAVLRAGRDEAHTLVEAVGRLWTAGVEVDWAGVFTGWAAVTIPLPTYAFQRQRYWPEPRIATTADAMDPAEARFWNAVERQDLHGLAGALDPPSQPEAHQRHRERQPHRRARPAHQPLQSCAGATPALVPSEARRRARREARLPTRACHR